VARFALVTLGSRGDVEPYIALGRGLVAAGHTARIVTHEGYRPWAMEHGLGFHPLQGDPETMVAAGDAQDWFDTGQSAVGFLQEFTKLMGEVVAGAIADTYAAADDTDVLVASGLGYYAVQAVAERTGLPWVQTFLQPVHPTRSVWSPMLPSRWQPAALNLVSHAVVGQAFWHLMRRSFDAARRDVLDLPRAPFFGPFPNVERQRVPALYAFSERVLPRPSEWPAHVHVTGYWFLDAEAAGYAPPRALAAFLAAGPRPVYVGFGSMSNRDPEAATRLVVGALADAGQRGVLLGGWSGLAGTELPAHVIHVTQVPHGWLFPRMAAVVHHGGAGTTAAGLRAGVPNVVVPFFADQPFWGRRVAALGVGPQPIPREKMTRDGLAAAIRSAVGDRGMAVRAADQGRRISAEDGVARAVALLEQTFAASAAKPGRAAGSMPLPLRAADIARGQVVAR
jgi:UDP:flavonoid glycosyltransferase YjiC (YdhE family)